MLLARITLWLRLLWATRGRMGPRAAWRVARDFSTLHRLDWWRDIARAVVPFGPVWGDTHADAGTPKYKEFPRPPLPSGRDHRRKSRH